MTVREFVLLAAMASVFAGIGSLFGAVEAAVALAASIVMSFWSYWGAAPEFLIRTRARPCRDANILALTAELASRAGIPAPEVFIFKDGQPNALALGANPEQSILVLTSALIGELNEDELRAVIAHELSHIRNRDVLACTLAATFVGAILSLAALLGLVGAALRRNGGAAMIAVAIFAPLIAILLRLAMSRSIEHRADRDAARLCGNPRHLISALQSLAQLTNRHTCRAAAQNPAFAAFFFVDPLPDSWLGALFSAHPAIERRIARLELMCSSGKRDGRCSSRDLRS